MKPVPLPPGLEDSNIEIYLNGSDLRVLMDGKSIPFKYIPDFAKEILEDILEGDPVARRSIWLDFGISDPDKVLEQYVKCNFGNFDGRADITTTGGVEQECWDCGQRGECPGEGKVCSRLAGAHGILTRKETELFFLVCYGYQDKEIAYMHGVSINTVVTQLRNIREKLGVNNRVEIMGFATKRNLLNV